MIRATSSSSRVALQNRFAHGWPSFVVLLFGCWFCGAAGAGVDVWTPIGPQGAQVANIVTTP